jgi:hypothetical protein
MTVNDSELILAEAHSAQDFWHALNHQTKQSLATCSKQAISFSKMSYCTSDDLVQSVLTSSQIDGLPMISRTGWSDLLAQSCSAHKKDCRDTYQSHIELLAHPAAELDSDQ